MFIYYNIQIKEDGIWHNDPTHSPVAIEQEMAHLLIELMNLDDDERLIRIEKSEAIEIGLGKILCIHVNSDGTWSGCGITI